MYFDLFHVSLQQGLILSFVGLGIMIPFRYFHFSDLTADGAFAIGSVVCAFMIKNNFNPFLSTLLGGFFAGILPLITNAAVKYLKVDRLLAGIIISTMTYSVSLRLLGKPNVALFDFSLITFGLLKLTLLCLLCIAPILFYLHTDFGLRFRAVGLSPQVAKNNFINVDQYLILGLFVSGFLVGLAGALTVQVQKFVDVNGTIAIRGLTSLIIGEILLKSNSVLRQVLAPVFGAIILQQVIGFAFLAGLMPSDLKFFVGIIIFCLLGIKNKSFL